MAWSPASCFFVLMLLLWSPTESAAAGLDTSLYVTNGTIYDIAVNGETVYIAGDFTRVGPVSGGGAGLDTATGDRIAGFPEINGSVYTVISDDQDPNGWYVGGDFTQVGSATQFLIAHILPNGTLDTTFAPFASYTVSGAARTMILDGGILYVGGNFALQAGAVHRALVAVDVSLSAIVSSWAPNPGGGDTSIGVQAMALSGPMLYVAGAFETIGEQIRLGLAALESLASNASSTGGADPDWDPSPGSGTVKTMVAAGGYLYVGGTFTTIGGLLRLQVAAIGTLGSGEDAGEVKGEWDPSATGGSVDALLSSGGHLYVGGGFTSVGGLPRNHLAVVDAVGSGDGTGRSNADWAPDIDATTISTMVLDAEGKKLYVGGDFTHGGGLPLNHLVRVDAIGVGGDAGSVDATWDPAPYGPVRASGLSTDGTVLLAGGVFAGIGGEIRNRIAAIDKTTGIATAWNPNIDGTVHKVLLDPQSEIVYVGGAFTQAGGNARNRIAALQTVSDDATDWNPGADAAVYTMLLDAGTLYVGGAFTQIGGGARNQIAALQTVGDDATDWNPGVSDADGDAVVKALAIYDTTLYVGGTFDAIGGSERNNVAALDTGMNAENATDWNPDLDGPVNAMHRSGSNLYVGGSFWWSGGDGVNDQDDPNGFDQGVLHAGIAVVDISRDTRSMVRAWNPFLSDVVSRAEIHTVVRDGLDLYAGGRFAQSLTTIRNNLARFTLEPPTVWVDLAAGSYPKPQFARISCTPAEGFVCETGHYTLDGSEPTAFSAIPIVLGGIYIEESAVLKLRVIDSAGAESPVLSLSYEIENAEDVVCFIDRISNGR